MSLLKIVKNNHTKAKYNLKLVKIEIKSKSYMGIS